MIRLEASFLASAFALALTACAAREPRVGTTSLTSADVGDLEAQAAASDASVGRYRAALALADQAVANAPDNAWAHYGRAVALRHLGDVDAAVDSYLDAEQRFGSNRTGKAVSMYGRARALADVGRCEEAKKGFTQFASFVESFDAKAAADARAIASDCRPTADPALGAFYDRIDKGRFAEALRAGEGVSKAGREDGFYDYARGVALAGVGNVDEAVNAFTQAEDRFGNDRRNRSIAIYGRARALDNAGRCDEARRAYQEYADLVRATSPSDAGLATSAARMCRPANVAPVRPATKR